MTHRTPILRRLVAIAVVLAVLGATASAQTFTNRGMASLFAADHGGEVVECPEWVAEIFPGVSPPGCLTLEAENLSRVRTLFDRTVAEIDGIAWTDRWDIAPGGDPRQMVHRPLEIDGGGFVITLRLAGESGDGHVVLVVIQRSGR
jgi:hypothetical protein